MAARTTFPSDAGRCDLRISRDTWIPTDAPPATRARWPAFQARSAGWPDRSIHTGPADRARAGRPRGPKQGRARPRPARPADPRPPDPPTHLSHRKGENRHAGKAGEAREVAGQETAGKMPQFEVHGHELRVDRLIAARREQPVLLPQHRADLVEPGRPQVAESAGERSPATMRRPPPAPPARDGSARGTADANSESSTSPAGVSASSCGSGRASSTTFSGSRASSAQAQFRLVDDLQERFTADHVTGAMRNPQAKAAQPPILLDDPAENPRQNQKRRRIGRCVPCAPIRHTSAASSGSPADRSGGSWLSDRQTAHAAPLWHTPAVCQGNGIADAARGIASPYGQPVAAAFSGGTC